MKTKRNYKSIDSLKNRVNQLNLYNLTQQSIYLNGAGWIKTNNLLTECHLNQVCELFGGQTKTKGKMFIVLDRRNFSKWYLERIIYSFTRKRFEYCAGQDYPQELKDIRKDLINRY